ncbi:polyprenyl synthetase family protein [Tissierella sp. Yu-01]|uniref:polyprenyl synthetase family protein n=1 Tax=Tissierella sp. Yu-01 TaxID=3035694 RepID=UPI00240DEDDC|nr:farnesyl diphosphate synthase [Tissierella sp. Yu-01]WFA09700.1 polyprenyl synthetase family protein [Tissierella sp. Yu-01]
MNIIEELEYYSNLIDNELMEIINNKNSYTSEIFEAIKYSLFTGGKRLRPIMAIKSYELFGDEVHKVMPFAVSIEMIHTYSLIHDDLPSMDNDDFRRGKPTNHKVFGEAMAILAGDGLLNLAFETVSNYIYNSSNSIDEFKQNVRAMREISICSGCFGMIGGQVLDLMSSSNNMNEDKLLYMYKSKTAALIIASLVSGAIVAGAREEEIRAMKDFGLNLGLAYQIKDDLLDYEEDENIDKFTYLKFHSLEEANEQVTYYSKKAIESLDYLSGRDTTFLKELANYLINRMV